METITISQTSQIPKGFHMYTPERVNVQRTPGSKTLTGNISIEEYAAALLHEKISMAPGSKLMLKHPQKTRDSKGKLSFADSARWYSLVNLARLTRPGLQELNFREIGEVSANEALNLGLIDTISTTDQRQKTTSQSMAIKTGSSPAINTQAKGGIFLSKELKKAIATAKKFRNVPKQEQKNTTSQEDDGVDWDFINSLPHNRDVE